MTFALTGARIFDGEPCSTVMPSSSRTSRIAARDAEQDLLPASSGAPSTGLLAPGFIDVQVNGGGGVLYNDARTVEGIGPSGGRTALRHDRLSADLHHRHERAHGGGDRGGARGLRRRVPGVLGIHLEGPFLNPAQGRPQSAHMRPIEEEDLRLMTSLGEGATLVTLAPERNARGHPPPRRGRRARLSAGHTAAIRACMEAIAQGLRGFTHLFNAMPPLAGREPGPVGAALDSRDTWCGLIVDGHHVDAILRVAIAAKGPDRMMLVTDAMPTVGTDLPQFELLGRTVHRTGRRLRCGRDAGGLRPRHGERRAQRGPPPRPEPAAGLRMASRVPAEFLRLGREWGYIALASAPISCFSTDLAVLETWIDGKDSAADAVKATASFRSPARARTRSPPALDDLVSEQALGSTSSPHLSQRGRRDLRFFGPRPHPARGLRPEEADRRPRGHDPQIRDRLRRSVRWFGVEPFPGRVDGRSGLRRGAGLRS